MKRLFFNRLHMDLNGVGYDLINVALDPHKELLCFVNVPSLTFSNNTSFLDRLSPRLMSILTTTTTTTTTTKQEEKLITTVVSQSTQYRAQIAFDLRSE